jgi:hypothetical protein
VYFSSQKFLWAYLKTKLTFRFIPYLHMYKPQTSDKNLPSKTGCCLCMEYCLPPPLQKLYLPNKSSYPFDYQAATLVLYVVKPKVETIHVCAYCRQSHGQILQQHEVSHKALLSVGSQISFFSHHINCFSGRIFTDMDQLLIASYCICAMCKVSNILLAYWHILIRWE